MSDKKKLSYEILIHIGFPKSGSSTLQHIFKNNKLINFLGIVRDHNTISKRKPSLNENFFRYVRGRNNNLEEALKIKKNISLKKFNVISDEDFLSSHPINFKDKLLRLKKIFPECKILIVLRDPIDTLISWHNFHIRGNFNIRGKFNKELLDIKNYINSDQSKYARDLIEFEEKIIFVEKEFGKNNLYLFNFDNTFKNNNLLIDLRKIFGQKFILQSKNIYKNSTFSFLNSIYERYNFIYKLKFFLPKILIKFLRSFIFQILFTKLENKYKSKINKSKKDYLQKKFYSQIMDYKSIIKNYNID